MAEAGTRGRPDGDERAPRGWPVPALLIAVLLVYAVSALAAMLATWAAIALMRGAGALPADLRLMELLLAPGAPTGPHAAAHFALVGVLFAVNALLTCGLTLVLARASLAGGLREAVPLDRAPARLMVVALLGVPALHAVSFLLVYLAAGQPLPRESGFDPLDWRMWPYPLAILLVAPFAEEIVFRGWLMAALARRLSGPLVMAATTALAWAAVHSGQGLAKALALVPVGLALAALRLASGSLWPGIAGHVAANALALAFMVWLAAG